jgi:hypothetical protein
MGDVLGIECEGHPRGGEENELPLNRKEVPIVGDDVGQKLRGDVEPSGIERLRGRRGLVDALSHAAGHVKSLGLRCGEVERSHARLPILMIGVATIERVDSVVDDPPLVEREVALRPCLLEGLARPRGPWHLTWIPVPAGDRPLTIVAALDQQDLQASGATLRGLRITGDGAVFGKNRPGRGAGTHAFQATGASGIPDGD